VHFIGADGLVAPQAHLTSSRTQSGAADSQQPATLFLPAQSERVGSDRFLLEILGRDIGL